MESPENALASLLEKAEEYGRTSFELYNLKLMETLSVVVTVLAVRFSVALVLVLFFALLSTGIALLLGGLLGKTFYGFFVLAGFYLLIGILLHFFMSGWIRTSITKSILRLTAKKIPNV
jgi:hypothetical protein